MTNVLDLNTIQVPVRLWVAMRTLTNAELRIILIAIYQAFGVDAAAYATVNDFHFLTSIPIPAIEKAIKSMVAAGWIYEVIPGGYSLDTRGSE